MKRHTLVGIALLASVVGIFFIVQPTSAASALTCTTLTAPLSYGADDGGVVGKVTALQNFLQAEGLFTLAPNGHFGPNTLAAVKKFQTSQGFEAVGSVGPLTRAAIQKISCAAATPKPTPSPTPAPVVTPTPPPAPQPVSSDTDSDTNSSVLSLPYRAPQFVGWQGTWGDVSTTSSGSLLVKAASSTTGAEVQFPGSADWTNYRVTANMLVSYTDLVIYARYVDAQNFLTCTFSNDGAVFIQQKVNGVTKTVASADLYANDDVQPPLATTYSTSVSMDVHGNTVGCSAQGPNDNVQYASVDPSLLTGGTGFTIWNPNNGFASEEIYSLDVEPL